MGDFTLDRGQRRLLDLTNNSAVIDYTGPVGTLVDDVRQHLLSGRLTSSSAMRRTASATATTPC